jgi:hypothetical protein
MEDTNKISQENTECHKEKKYDDDYISNLKDKIEKLDKDKHIDIFKIFKENNIPFSENSNGIFINISEINDTIIEKLGDYVDYFYKQENILNKAEKEKEKYAKEFYKIE